jgi:hypothetical protein
MANKKLTQETSPKRLVCEGLKNKVLKTLRTRGLTLNTGLTSVLVSNTASFSARLASTEGVFVVPRVFGFTFGVDRAKLSFVVNGSRFRLEKVCCKE